MGRIFILLILAAAVGGCSPPPESAFVSEFSAEALIEKNLPEKATFFHPSEDKSTVDIDSVWKRRPLRLLDSKVECLIDPADENEFMEALKTEVEALIQSSGAEIQTRISQTTSFSYPVDEMGEAREETPAILGKFEFGYVTRDVRGFIWVRGVRCEERRGERYMIIILICEG